MHVYILLPPALRSFSNLIIHDEFIVHICDTLCQVFVQCLSIIYQIYERKKEQKTQSSIIPRIPFLLRISVNPKESMNFSYPIPFSVQSQAKRCRNADAYFMPQSIWLVEWYVWSSPCIGVKFLPPVFRTMPLAHTHSRKRPFLFEVIQDTNTHTYTHTHTLKH